MKLKQIRGHRFALLVGLNIVAHQTEIHIPIRRLDGFYIAGVFRAEHISKLDLTIGTVFLALGHQFVPPSDNYKLRTDLKGS